MTSALTLPQQPDDASVVWYQDVPRSIRRQAVFGLALLAFSFGGFGLWAFRAPLAAAVIAQGSFVATGQNKIVQHLEGGIIKEILVAEGDPVRAGDVILRLDQTHAAATNRELLLRRARLEATQARLLAEHEGRRHFALPAHLEALRDDPETAAILESQTLAFTVSRAGLMQEQALVQRNLDALGFRGQGFSSQRDALKGQVALLEEELETKTALHERGLIARTEMLALQRALLEGAGQIARIEAELGEISEMRSKYTTELDRIAEEYRRNALAQLQVIQSELESIREQARRSEHVLVRTEVLAPVDGKVVRLYYNTPGGVIETGRAIAEILPADAPLIIEAVVARGDIDTVRVGQPATVRLTALNQRTTPVLNAEVSYVSPDAVSDGNDRRQRDVYITRVALDPAEIDRVRGFTPVPGMPAEVMIQTAERTFANYIARPVIDSMSRAFREQ